MWSSFWVSPRFFTKAISVDRCMTDCISRGKEAVSPFVQPSFGVFRAMANNATSISYINQQQGTNLPQARVVYYIFISVHHKKIKNVVLHSLFAEWGYLRINLFAAKAAVRIRLGTSPSAGGASLDVPSFAVNATQELSLKKSPLFHVSQTSFKDTSKVFVKDFLFYLSPQNTLPVSSQSPILLRQKIPCICLLWKGFQPITYTGLTLYKSPQLFLDTTEISKSKTVSAERLSYWILSRVKCYEATKMELLLVI